MDNKEGQLVTTQSNSSLISLRLFSQLCGIVAVGLGMLATVGWMMGSGTLTGISTHHIPMAPNTAIFFIALGVSLYALGVERKWSLRSSRLSAAMILVLSLIYLAEFSLNIDLHVDRWFLKVPTSRLGLIPEWKMSLPTAIDFFFASIALLLTSSFKRNFFVGVLARILAGLTTLIGLAFFLGYVYSAPLLYGGTTLPMALNSAIGFFVLGLGLVVNILSHDIMERKEAADALRKAHDELEIKVAERTKELAKSNEALRAEIVEREEAEEQLRVRTTAMESAANGIAITDRDGSILWVNPAFTHITGYAAEEVIGQSPRFLNSGKQHPSFYKNLWDAILSGQVWRGEIVNRRKDGNLYTEEMTITPVRNEVGEITRFIAIKHDISERKRVEDELVMLRTAVETSGEAIFLTDLRGIITFMNPQFTRLYGFTSQEVIGKVTPRILKSGMTPPEVYEQFWKTLLNKQAVSGEIVNKTKDGRLITVQDSVSPILSGHGNIVGFLAIQWDITELKQAEEERYKSEERFRKVVEDIFKFVPEAVLVFTKDLDVYKHNKAFQDIVQKYANSLNYGEEELADLITKQVVERLSGSNETEIRIPRKEA